MTTRKAKGGARGTTQARTKGSALDDLAIERLKKSGLTREDGEQLGLTVLSRDDVTRLDRSFKPLRALRIPYLGLDGEPLIDWPTGGPFYRLRYLEEPKDFASMGAKVARYAQPPRTAP